MTSEIQSILDRVQNYLPDADLARIEAAYRVAKKAHEGQLRFSGEPYITHPVTATEILLDLQPDEDAICACLLHDVVEDTEVDLLSIEKEFGKTVAQLCGGLEKLSAVRFQGQERQVENLRKMFVAMAADLRVIFIKLADRLHNMQTLDAVRPDKQRRIASETMEIYAPIAARLGLFDFKKQLEDLSFKYLYPKDYARVVAELKGSEASRARFVKNSMQFLAQIMREAGVEAAIMGRTKHRYSIWKKMKKKGFESIDDIYDLFALRVMVQNPRDCYAALGVIHEHCTPLSHRFKDFIAVPKANGYQSLHTTVLGLNTEKTGQPTEIQIRTYAMHAEAERGAAAHWQYSEKKESRVIATDKLKWVQGLVELHDKLKDNDEFAATLAHDTLGGRIFVLTPRGDVIDLPEGATPLDFAYTVHTDVGHRTVGAKINGRISPLGSTLDNGDVIEILTKKDSEPRRTWLSLVKSEGAKSKIRSFFNALDKHDNVTAGKDLLNKYLARLSKEPLDQSFSILKSYKGHTLSHKERLGMLERVGNGSVNPGAIMRELFPGEFLPVTKKKAVVVANNETRDGDIRIAGERGLHFQLGKCCKPKEGQNIVALMSRRGATIHRIDCRQLARAHPERRLAASWGEEAVPREIRFAMEGHNRVGLLRDLTGTLADLGVDIVDISARTKNAAWVANEFSILVPPTLELDTVFDHIERVAGVTSVRRTS